MRIFFIPSLFASLLSSSLFFSSHSVILGPHYPPHQKQHGRFLTPSLPKCLMEFCKASLTFESADEILWCDHSSESSLPVLLYLSPKQNTQKNFNNSRLRFFTRIQPTRRLSFAYVEYTVGRTFEIGFISMSIISQLQYLGVSWEMQTVNIGTIIKPHSTQNNLTFRFQNDKITV